jgi:SIR2-like domain
MASHDPRREIEKLREHLAAHDRPIAFLLGAGTSCSVRDVSGQPLIPNLAVIGDRCRAAMAALGADYAAAYDSLVEESRSDSAVRVREPNVEQILDRVRLKISSMTSDDILAGVDRSHLADIEQAIRNTIATAVMPDASSIPVEIPHHALARWVGRATRSAAVEIFTTNYDTLLERGLEDQRVPVFDGFVGSREPFFEPRSLAHEQVAPGAEWCRLWKIHGSVNWRRREAVSGERRIVRGEESTSGEMIFPSYEKYDKSRKQPYTAILDRLQRFLSAREDAVLVVLGYSFGDQHINEVVFDALKVRERLHVFAVQYSDPISGDDLWVEAMRTPNLIVYGPTAAIVGTIAGEWRLVEPVEDSTSDLLDIPFDSDAEPEHDQQSLTGRFRLGDFAWFARYLDRMVDRNA